MIKNCFILYPSEELTSPGSFLYIFIFESFPIDNIVSSEESSPSHHELGTCKLLKHNTTYACRLL